MADNPRLDAVSRLCAACRTGSDALDQLEKVKRAFKVLKLGGAKPLLQEELVGALADLTVADVTLVLGAWAKVDASLTDDERAAIWLLALKT